MLCAPGRISHFPFTFWQCTQDWYQPLQIFILSSFSHRAAPWPDLSVTYPCFGVAKSVQGN